MISSQDGTDARRGRPVFFAGLAGSFVPFAAATLAGTSAWSLGAAWSARLGWPTGPAASAASRLRAAVGALRRSKSRVGSGWLACWRLPIGVTVAVGVRSASMIAAHSSAGRQSRLDCSSSGITCLRRGS